MVCVVLATWRRHVGMSPFFGEKIPDTTPTFPAKLHCCRCPCHSRHSSMAADAHQGEDKGDNANVACRGSATMHRAHHDKRRGVRGRPPKHNNQIRPTLGCGASARHRQRNNGGGGQFRHEGADAQRPQGRIRETKRMMMMTTMTTTIKKHNNQAVRGRGSWVAEVAMDER